MNFEARREKQLLTPITVPQKKLESGWARLFFIPARLWAGIIILNLSTASKAQYFQDSLLFTISLKEDSGSLFGCAREGEIHQNLSGPILMDKGTLLFCSENGYALYSTNGKIIETFDITKKNRRYQKKNEPTLRYAYPVDKKNILFYRDFPESKGGIRIFQKEILSSNLKEIDKNKYEHLNTIKSAHLFNLLNNTITNEMSRKSFLEPQLVGYSSPQNGDSWWSLDKFYSFTSPIIGESQGKLLAFFCGFRRNQDCGEVRESLIEPLGLFQNRGRYYLWGVYTPNGTKLDTYNQILFLSDYAGNLLYTNSLLKRTMIDAVLGENVAEKMLYTVRRASQLIFVPSIDSCGNMYFGMIDYRARIIEVTMRMFYHYAPFPTGPELEDMIEYETGIRYTVDQAETAGESKTMHTNLYGESRVLEDKELTKNGYSVTITHEINEELKKKLSRPSDLPDRVRQILDSLTIREDSYKLYGISLSYNKKELNSLAYGINEKVLGARILQITESNEIFVRVDLETWSEIIVFSTRGGFLNRFCFNTLPYIFRNDCVVVSKNRKIIEKDFEVGNNGYRFLSWQLTPYTSTR